jgi:hypothetical protein
MGYLEGLSAAAGLGFGGFGGPSGDRTDGESA